MDDDELFDDRDLMELIELAVYLEGKSSRRLFPRARSERYSDSLYRLIHFLRDKLVTSKEIAEIADDVRKLFEPLPSDGSAKILTHPRFGGRHKRGPPR
jgi:hypothetical protein